MLPSKSVPTTGRGSGKRKRGVDKEPSRVSEHGMPADNAVVQVDEDTIHVNGLEPNAPQEKRTKKEVKSL